MQKQNSLLDYRIDLYFHDYKLAIKFDENGHSDKNIDDEIKRLNAITQNLVVSLLKLILTKKTLMLLKL